MGFNNRTPVPLDPAASPLLPQADSSQAHDIPTGVSPTTAKLQDWIAWLRANGIYNPTGNVHVTGQLTVDGNAILDAFLALTGSAPTVTADPGSNVFHSAMIPKVCGRIITDGAGGYTIPSSGVNLGLATLGSTYVDVDFVRPFANNDYVPVVTNISGTASRPAVDYANSTASKIRLHMRDTSDTLIDPTTNVCRWSLIVMGRH